MLIHAGTVPDLVEGKIYRAETLLVDGKNYRFLHRFPSVDTVSMVDSIYIIDYGLKIIYPSMAGLIHDTMDDTC
jgi:hypothetical protein